MNDKIENRFSMFLKVNTFLKSFNATLAAYPAIIALHNELKALIDEIASREGDATINTGGYKVQKDGSRIALVAATVKVSSALFARWLNTGSDSELKKTDYTLRELTRRPDGNLYLRASKLHELADPVKAMLAPYNCTPADVDALALKNKRFFDDVEAPKKARQIKADARKEVTQLMKQGTAILKNLDVYLATFSPLNRNMYHQYKSARAVDQSGGRKKAEKKESMMAEA